MRSSTLLRTFTLIALAAMVSLPATAAPPDHARGERGREEQQGRGQDREEQRRMSAQEAAARAQAQYGGRVLKVSPQGAGYRVRLLQEDGRVMTVSIGG